MKIYFSSSYVDLKISPKLIFDLALNLNLLKFQIRNPNFLD